MASHFSLREKVSLVERRVLDPFWERILRRRYEDQVSPSAPLSFAVLERIKKDGIPLKLTQRFLEEKGYEARVGLENQGSDLYYFLTVSVFPLPPELLALEDENERKLAQRMQGTISPEELRISFDKKMGAKE